MSAVPALGRLEQDNCSRSAVSQGFTVRTNLSQREIQCSESPKQTLLSPSAQQSVFVDDHRRALFLGKGRLRPKEADEMAQEGRRLSSSPTMSSILGPIWWRERTPEIPLTFSHAHHSMCVPAIPLSAHTKSINKSVILNTPFEKQVQCLPDLGSGDKLPYKLWLCLNPPGQTQAADC